MACATSSNRHERRTDMQSWVLLVGLLLTLGTRAAHSAEAEGAPTDAPATDDPSLELFVGPERLDMKEPKYPVSARRRSEEGWVYLNFMIDAHGKPYEIAAVESAGGDWVERAAVDALERSTFMPASIDGTAVDAGYTMKYTFALSGPGSGARRSFVKRFRAFRRAVDDEDRETAREHLASLDVTNLYEDGFLSIARAVYAEAWGTAAEQRQALSRAIAREKDATFLPQDLYRNALLTLFVLEVGQGNYARALDLSEQVRSLDLDDGARSSLEATVARIRTLAEDDTAYSVSGAFGEATSWYYPLLKDEFYVTVGRGEIAEIKLRCERKYVFFRYQPDIQYKIPEQYGRCGMELVGSPGTEFELTQT